jgi:preprotein translocase subunit SecG
MYTVLLICHVVVAVSLIGLVLLQQGKGADAGAAFGSGASSTVFGARGSSSFITRITAGLATGFFVISLTLAFLAGRQSEVQSVTDLLAEEPVESVLPAATTQPESEVPMAPAGEQ